MSHERKGQPLTLIETLSVLSLGGFLWIVTSLLPKARREQDAFVLVCTYLAAGCAVTAWLFLGIRTPSTTWSVASLAGFLWVVAFQLPRARRERDGALFAGALVAVFLLLVGSLLVGGAVVSG